MANLFSEQVDRPDVTVQRAFSIVGLPQKRLRHPTGRQDTVHAATNEKLRQFRTLPCRTDQASCLEIAGAFSQLTHKALAWKRLDKNISVKLGEFKLTVRAGGR